MGTISVTLPSDGDTIDAADVNNPINTIVTAINGNLDSNNVSAGGLTPANLTSGTGTSWAWQTFTPSLTNWTIGTGGSAATIAKYIQIGKLVVVRIKSTLGTSGQSVSGIATFNLPVTASSNFAALDALNIVRMQAAATGYTGYFRLASTSSCILVPMSANATYVGDGTMGATTPDTWAAGDFFSGVFMYEAA